MQPKQPVSQANREQSKADAAAIKSDYKRWDGDLSHKDLVNHLKTCYNTYNDNGRDLGLHKDLRMSYIDRAVAYQQILEYIERQAS